MADCVNEYVPTQWVNGTAPAINAVNLNHIENGIKDTTDCLVETIEKLENFVPQGSWHYDISEKTLYITGVPEVD